MEKDKQMDSSLFSYKKKEDGTAVITKIEKPESKMVIPAYLDGCGPFMTFIRVMVPNAKTSFLTVFIFSIVWYWNDSYVTGMFFTDPYTIAMEIDRLGTTMMLYFTGERNGMASDYLVWIEAGCLMSLMPILIMYIFLQKQFVEGIERSGLAN